MRVLLKSASSTEIYSDFSSECSNCIEECSSESKQLVCPLHGDKRRIGKIENEKGKVFCCTTQKDFLKSSKTFRKQVESKLLGNEHLTLAKEKLNRETKKLLHNLTKTNGHNIQELYALVPQEIITQNLSEQLNTIAGIISSDPTEAAKTFLRIAKNNAAMKTEFSVFNKLIDSNPSLHKKWHPIKKVTLNLFHPFFQKFKELNVYVQVEDNEDYVFFDYESIHVSLYHLIDNASKYVLKGTTVYVKFIKSDGFFSVILDMISLRIEDNERSRVLEDGFSGENAKKTGRAGDGIGLGRVSKILNLNDAQLIISRNTDNFQSPRVNGLDYDNNIFEVKLRYQPPRKY